MIETINKELVLRFPTNKFSVLRDLREDHEGEISISYGAYTRPGDVQKIERFVKKIMERDFPNVAYTLERMAF
jgi:hypothetical protein